VAGIVHLPDVDHLDLEKRRHTRGEAVNPRSDIDMSGRYRRVNKGGDEQILVKIMPAGGTGLIIITSQNRENVRDCTTCYGERPPILPKPPQVAQILYFAGGQNPD